jgi:hypothetical protein
MFSEAQQTNQQTASELEEYRRAQRDRYLVSNNILYEEVAIITLVY